MKPQVTILLVTWNAASYIGPCLDALLQQTTTASYNILIVDNASHDQTVEIIQTYPVTLLRNSTNTGFAGGNNCGIRSILEAPDTQPEDIVICLNYDTIVASDWLQHMLEALNRHPQAGVIGCKMFFPESNILQHAGGLIEWHSGRCPHYFAHEPDQGQADQERTVDFVTGAAMAMPIHALQAVGMFDEAFNPAYYEDVDLCVRMQHHGYEVVYTPYATLQHFEGAQQITLARSQLFHRNRLQFLLKYQASSAWLNEFWQTESTLLNDTTNELDLLSRQFAYFYALNHLRTWKTTATEPQQLNAIRTCLNALFEVAWQKQN